MEPKKNPKLDLSKKSGLFLNIGMAVSLLIVILAFEWKTYDDAGLLDLGNVDDDFDEILDIPLTINEPPPPPKVNIPEIVEVPDEEEIEEIEAVIDTDVDENESIEEIVITEAPAEEKIDEIFTIVEEPASFPGGLEAFYSYLKDELEYPRQALRMGMEGRVFVEFIVERDGSLTDLRVVRSVGAGLDEEALRVLKNSPKWKPGKQRGKPVRQKMIQFISFKLTN